MASSITYGLIAAAISALTVGTLTALSPKEQPQAPVEIISSSEPAATSRIDPDPGISVGEHFIRDRKTGCRYKITKGPGQVVEVEIKTLGDHKKPDCS